MTRDVIQLPFSSKREAEKALREIAQNSSENFLICDHASLRMTERGITRKQVIQTVRLGDLVDAPEWCLEKERGWRCKFRRVIAGTKITVVAKLIKREENTCLVITSWEN